MCCLVWCCVVQRCVVLCCVVRHCSPDEWPMKILVVLRVTGAIAGRRPGRLTANTGIIVAARRVIFLPRCIAAGVCVRQRRSRGPCKGRNNSGNAEVPRPPKLFCFSVFPICRLNLRHNQTLTTRHLTSASLPHCLPLLVCTALTEPGQLPLGRHRVARLVWGSPGLPATFRAKPHGMSDGTQTPIMVLAVGFFFPPFYPLCSFRYFFWRPQQNGNSIFRESASK